MPNRPIPSPEHIKALAVDLDGTLLRPDNSLSGRTLTALNACLSRGMKVIICTGRSGESAEPYRRAIGAAGPMVYFNGAQVTEMPGGKILNAALLEPDVVNYCVDLARRKGVYYQAYLPQTPTLLITERYAEEAEQYRRHTGVAPVAGDVKAATVAPGIGGCIKSMFITDPSFHDAIRAELQERFGDAIYLVRSAPTFLEVLKAGVSKGFGLTHALSHCGLSRSQVIAFGDEENDLPLFSASAFAAAPANAQEAVRRAADTVIPSHKDDGVAAFLEAFLT